MSAVRVTHTPCGMAVDLTDDNRITTADTQLEHHCPVTDGPINVIRWGTRWSLDNILDRTQHQPMFTTLADAQTEANRRNTAYQAAHTPTPAQPDLFSSQEATS